MLSQRSTTKFIDKNHTGVLFRVEDAYSSKLQSDHYKEISQLDEMGQKCNRDIKEIEKLDQDQDGCLEQVENILR